MSWIAKRPLLGALTPAHPCLGTRRCRFLLFPDANGGAIRLTGRTPSPVTHDSLPATMAVASESARPGNAMGAVARRVTNSNWEMARVWCWSEALPLHCGQPRGAAAHPLMRRRDREALERPLVDNQGETWPPGHLTKARSSGAFFHAWPLFYMRMLFVPLHGVCETDD